MKFEEVLKYMRKGKKVCNSNKPTDVYRMNEFGHLEIINDNFPDGCHSSISGDDIFTEDWEIVDDLVYHSKSDTSNENVKENDINVVNEKEQDLTEEWKKGKLEEYKKYYCKTKWFEDIFQVRCYNKDTEDEWWVLENEKYKYNNVYHTKDIEVLAPAPSFEEFEQLQNWADFTKDYHELREKLEIAEYKNAELENKMDLERQLCKYVLEENTKLKELLKECKHIIEWYKANYNDVDVLNEDVITKIDNVIGEMQKDDHLL